MDERNDFVMPAWTRIFDKGKYSGSSLKWTPSSGYKKVSVTGAGRSRSRRRNHDQKRSAYDLVKTTFRFRLRLCHLRSTYDLVKTRLSESEG